ncbi:hypothetical protein JST97_26225 [bacterium]|nr:hypothetical protein [bacterium]
MSARFVWGIFLIAVCALPVCADEAPPAPEEASPWKGRYKLSISNDAAWHNDALDIDTASVEEMEGTVEVDLGLGPEGREPNADETLHKVKFKGRRSSDTDPYVAEVMVGSVQPRVYRFELFPIEPGKSLAGTVTMGSKRAGALVRRD